MSLEQMRDWSFELPDQLRLSVERAQARGWPDFPPTAADGKEPVGPTFVGGMGGSAVSARISRSLLASELRGPIEIGADPLLPSWVGGSGPTGLISYSGQTWEVLALWEQLGSRGTVPWVVASGGELVERARAAGAPHLIVPSGYAPRAAFGWLLPSVALALAAPLGAAATAQVGDRFLAASRTLGAERDLWLKAGALPGRDPVRLAAVLAGRRVAFLVSHEADLALAYRWKNQFEENAKQVSSVVLFPEASHNEIEGWSRLGGGDLVFIETPTHAEEPERVRSGRDAAVDAVLDVAIEAGLGVHRVPSNPGSDTGRWTGFLSQILLADAVSVQVAEIQGIDPEPVPVLGAVKDTVRRRLGSNAEA